jgi:predicted CoA-substrate-specific enzyme activase
MLFSGIDIGSLTAKAVIIENDRIITSHVIPVKRNPTLSATLVYKEALAKVELKPTDITFCVGTGYGRGRISYANKTLSEISCHGKGAYVLDPSIRTIIDIGGQDCKVIVLNDKGEMQDFLMNDKCAAGTGRYLEIMAELLNVTLDDLGEKALKSKSPVSMSSVCSIYAQMEVLKLISKKIKKEDILAGINRAMAERVVNMTRKMRIKPTYTMSGGVAKNTAVVKYISQLLQIDFMPLPIDSQLVGALGAAHFAKLQ